MCKKSRLHCPFPAPTVWSCSEHPECEFWGACSPWLGLQWNASWSALDALCLWSGCHLEGISEGNPLNFILSWIWPQGCVSRLVTRTSQALLWVLPPKLQCCQAFGRQWTRCCVFCLLVNVCILFLVLTQSRVLTSSSSLNNSLLFLGLCQWLLQLEVPGSYGSDSSSSAGTVLVRRWINVTAEESTSGLYSTLGK